MVPASQQSDLIQRCPSPSPLQGWEAGDESICTPCGSGACCALATEEVLESLGDGAGLQVAAQSVLLGVVHLRPAPPDVLVQDPLDALDHLRGVAGDLAAHGD